MAITTEFSSNENELTISINGNFDFKMHADFRSTYTSVPSSTKFIINLNKTMFIDSSGIGMLFLLREYAGEKNANIRLINCNENIRKVIYLSKLNKMFTIG